MTPEQELQFVRNELQRTLRAYGELVAAVTTYLDPAARHADKLRARHVLSVHIVAKGQPVSAKEQRMRLQQEV